MNSSIGAPSIWYMLHDRRDAGVGPWAVLLVIASS